MSDNTDYKERRVATREEFSRVLKARAEQIKSVRNDVYTTRWWQMLINFVTGVGAIALLICGMVLSGTASVVCTIVGIAFVIFVVVYNYALRAVSTMSFLQYTYLDVEKDKCYCFMVLGKSRSAFSDGQNNIEVERGEVFRLAERTYARYRYDFFADMAVDMHIIKDGRETFTGKVEVNGKQYKSKIVFKDDMPLYGSVGGGRIKYFDINDTKNKFVVPSELKRGVKEMGVNFPKVPGLHVRDDIDARKQ